MAKEDVLLIPAPTPHRNFHTNDMKTNKNLSSTKSSKPRPTIDTIYSRCLKVLFTYNKQATEDHATGAADLIQVDSRDERRDNEGDSLNPKILKEELVINLALKRICRVMFL